MKTLKEYINEYINESLLDDEEVLYGKIENKAQFMAKYVTLWDCLNGCVTNSLKRNQGPTHHKVAEYSKLFNKKYKAPSLVDRNGKKLNPGVLGDIVAGAASQIMINWELPPQERLEKALSELDQLVDSTKFPEIEKYKSIDNFNPADYKGKMIDTDRHTFGVDADKQYVVSRSPKYGYKVFKTKNGVVGSISIDYGAKKRYKSDGNEWEFINSWSYSGYYEIFILDSSPIMVDINSL